MSRVFILMYRKHEKDRDNTCERWQLQTSTLLTVWFICSMLVALHGPYHLLPVVRPLNERWYQNW